MGNVYMMEHHCGCSSSSGGVIPLLFFLSSLRDTEGMHAMDGRMEGWKEETICDRSDGLFNRRSSMMYRSKIAP